MLILTRNHGQTLKIGNDITVTVYRVPNSNQVRLVIDAPKNINIVRDDAVKRVVDKAI
ncbi:MAG: carbon storage regulator [Flavobacteriales bacterium]|nr:carbon storage regulator [Flavobacteriales bacterium]